MKKILICILFFPVLVNAQIIHGHPQKSSYANSSEWPTYSGQCHWRAIGQSMPSHTHLDIHTAFNSEITGQTIVYFTVTLFHLDGNARFENSEGVTSIIWDSGNNILVGNPMGIVVGTGHIIIDPTLPTRWHTDHGWWAPLISLATRFTNGDVILNQAAPRFFSMIDPNIPESAVIGPNPGYGAACLPSSAAHPDIQWGNNFVITEQYLPITTLNSSWSNIIQTAGYGAHNLPPAVFQYRVDLDLHNGIPGRILETITQAGDVGGNITFDPAVIGSGLHKVALFRNQQSEDGTEEVDTLFVMTLNFDTSAIPETCQEVGATNIGAPLPCVFPVVPSDMPFNPNFLETPDHHFKMINPNTGTIKIF